MKIAFLTPEYVTPGRTDGGLANYIRKTAISLLSRGCEVWVFVLSQRNVIWHDEGVTICEVNFGGVPRFLARVPYFSHLVPTLDRIIASRKLAKQFWSIHNKAAFDIIQTSSYHVPGYALLQNGKVPLVCRISSYTPLWRSTSCQQRNFANYLLEWVEIRQVLDSDASYAPSEFIANFYRQIECYTPDIIRTPIDCTNINLDDSVLQKNGITPPYLLFFGTLNRVKGTDLMAQVLPELLRKYKDLACVFIGRDDGLPKEGKVFDYICEKCTDYVHKLHYFPSMQKSQLYPFIINAEAILLPSRVDNYPNACLEALMLGKTVVAANNSSIEEMISSGENGFLFNNNEPDSLLCCIEKCLQQSFEERKALSFGIKASFDRIVNEDRVGQLLKYYGSVIQNFKENGIKK